MKRALIASALAVALLSLTAFAGFYGEITSDLGNRAISLEAGLSSLAAFSGDLGYIPVAGLGFDLYGRVLNILGPPVVNPVTCGFNVAILGTEITLDLGMDFEFDQTAWSTYLLMNQWDSTITLTGHPGDITTIWGEVVLVFSPLAIGSPASYNRLVPTFELGIRVEIP